MSDATCLEVGCDRRAIACGLCRKHYNKRKYNGESLPPKLPVVRKTCTIEGCGKPARTRGYCVKHYTRWLNHGDTETVLHLAKYPPDAACKVDDCTTRPRSNGYCQPHYDRWKSHGDPLISVQARYGPADACQATGCDERPIASGYCVRHWNNWRRTGNPIPRKDWSLEDRLRDIGWTVTESGCWEWGGGRSNGYGLFHALKFGYKDARAHRAVYECFVGPIPDGLVLRHKCDNPPCVNPDHLVPGTTADNSNDMVERGRSDKKLGPVCRNGHDTTLPGATRTVTPKGSKRSHRICVECTRAAGRRHSRKKWQAIKEARAAAI